MFLAPADLPGVSIIPLDLYTAGTIGQVWGTAADTMPGQKNQVFFDDVRVHESFLIGGDRDGWKVTNATLMVEHGTASALEVRMPRRNFLVETFLKYCRSNSNVVNRLKENPQLLERVVNIYVGAEIERLWELRNSWLQSTGRAAPGTGPQLSLYVKMFGGRLVSDIAEVVGPYALIDDAEWGLHEGMFEVAERCANLLAPAGTPEAHKIIMSRALRIGR